MWGHFALAQILYFAVRLLQRFDKIERTGPPGPILYEYSGLNEPVGDVQIRFHESPLEVVGTNRSILPTLMFKRIFFQLVYKLSSFEYNLVSAADMIICRYNNRLDCESPAREGCQPCFSNAGQDLPIHLHHSSISQLLQKSFPPIF